MDAHEDTRRIQVLSVSDTGRRRRWTDDEKVQIVEESHGDGVTLAEVARRHDISRSQLYDWRYRHKIGLLGAGPQFLRVFQVKDGFGRDDVPAPPASVLTIDLGPVDLHRSTLSDWVGRTTALLEPLAEHIGKLVRAGPALFADDTPVKLQVRVNTMKTKTARLWSYVRDERPWCGAAPPCAWYQFSVDRKSEHPANHLTSYTGTVHADGYRLELEGQSMRKNITKMGDETPQN